MTVYAPILGLGFTLAALVACEGGGGASTGTTPAADTATATADPANDPTGEPTSDAATEPTSEPTSEPASSAEAEPEGDGGAEPEPTAKTPEPEPASAKATATPSASASAGDPKKKWSCGNKGQKACPMQGWMKGVMARAMASGDNEKIAKALNTIAAKPVAGYAQWTAIAAEGASKASAGDIDGAKKACKKCHALYQKKYIATRRDQPW